MTHLRPLVPLVAACAWAVEVPAPAGWWSFDAGDVAGDTVYDRVGSAHAVLGEGTRLVPGQVGQGVLIGGRVGVVQCQGAPALGQQFTLAAWFRSAHLGNQQHTIYGGDVKGCHYLRVNPDGRLVLGLQDVRLLASSKGTVAAGVWTHVAVAWRADGSYGFFINGQDAGSGTVAGAAPFTQAGRASLGQATAGIRRRTCEGEIDEVRAYAVALDPAAVAALAAATVNPAEDPALAAARPAPAPALRLRAAAVDHWFTAGSPVVFTVEPGAAVPAGLSALAGTVYDRQGRELAVVSVARDELVARGWAWTPPGPGFYEVAFAMSVDGRRQPLADTYNYQQGKGGAVPFSRERRTLTVVPVRTGKGCAQFGLSYEDERDAPRAARLGLGFARLWLPWGAKGVDESGGIELQQGVYRWEKFDPHLAALKAAGIDDLAVLPIYTPRWASPHPEDDKIDICVIGRHVWAPTRVEYYTDFLRAAVKRYGDRVRTWELWNEPHLPGGSVFWKDSPEAFVNLLRAGYHTLKQEQPGCEVWIGGMGGKRYLPFYKAILKLGAVPFDRLAIHGSWPELAGFRALEQQSGAPSKPWLSSEWHAILLDAQREVPSEQALARRLVLDACHHLQQGAGRLATFCMEEGEEFEKEMLPRVAAEGRFGQSSGLFRSRPRSEPRLAAAALATLTGQIRTRLEFRGLADLDQGVRLAWFADGDGTLAVVWGVEREPVALPALLAGGSARTAIDGSPWPAGAPLAADDLLFVRDLPAAQLAALPASARPIRPDQRALRATGPVVAGVRGEAPLLDAGARLLPAAAPRWNAEGWRWVGAEAKERPAGFAARFALAAGDHGLDLVVEVDDPVFHQRGELPGLWNGDSLQFALDCDGSAAWRNQVEFLFARRPGDTWLVKTQVPGFDGDLPQRWSPAWKQVEHARALVEPRPGGLRYAVHVERSELYPWAYDPAAPLRFSLLVNDSDGGGRLGWLEWGGGIGEGKEPERYGRLAP
jgi:hypothetical protein